MVPERLFSFTWHPYAIEPGVDYSDEPPTLVEFRLEPRGDGTLLTVTESGFDRIPAHRRDEAFRMNDGGWTEQVQNIKRHVRSEEHTSELQSLMRISSAVFCLKKIKTKEKET